MRGNSSRQHIDYIEVLSQRYSRGSLDNGMLNTVEIGSLGWKLDSSPKFVTDMSDGEWVG